ncbi:FAD-dependent oxidoreductase [Micromonospora sp. NPDC005203]|uniref:FAD-dependent oxidoreductase n=1 Tax=Micromonospora sp. NPDC005203 TaxID=3364226 RepID=UPI00369559D3
MSTRRVVIVGAGIGGLTTAIALRRIGIDVVVIERAGADELAKGVGVHLWSNAIRALQHIDLADQVAEIGTEVTAHRNLDWRGRRLGSFDLAALSDEFGAPSVGMSHPDLHRLLLQTLGPDVLRLNSELIGFEQNTQRVVARLADGSVERGDLLIGADGIASMVRRQLHGPTKPRYSGMAAWHGITDYTDPQIPVSEMRTYWGPGARILHYHVTGQRLYWLAMLKSPPCMPEPPAGRQAAVLKTYRGWPAHIQRMIAATEPDAILRNDVVDRDPLQHWGFERASLLGDAAHPMTPDMAQSAGQAVEDAVCLAGILKAAADPVAALREYEQRRTGRANEFVRTSRMVSRMSVLDAARLRVVGDNVVLRAVHAIQRSRSKARTDLIARP